MPSPAQIAVAARIAAQLDTAAPRERGALIAAGCAELGGIAAQTLYAWVKPHRAKVRKRRADAHAGIIARSERGLGADDGITLTAAEAHLIATTLTESGRGARGREKQLMSLKQAVEVLRTQGLIQAGRIDLETGEFFPLSLSAIGRGLRTWGLHPEQLKVPTPHQPLRTTHPNQRWEVDASVCVVYYLPGGGCVIQELDPTKHYKNKPEHLAAIAEQRVIRYVLTDHTTGVIRWRYYPHSESGAHTVAFLCWCMAPKADPADPFHGAPFTLVTDPGATAAGTVRRFCALLSIDLAPTLPHNPRAKGSVEKAQDLVERHFESGLRFQSHRVTDFNSLNALAAAFQLHYNRTAIHTRHGLTRFDAWLRIRPAELRITEPESVLRALATEAPATPKVRGDLTVQYRGACWDVRQIPGATIGAKIEVLYCPLLGTTGQGHAVAVLTDPESGQPVYRPLTRIEQDGWGFRADAPEAGVDYASMPDTRSDTLRKRLALDASGAATQRDDAALRRRKDFRPLAHLDEGRGVDPYRAAETATPPAYLPRRGTEHRVPGAVVEPILVDLDAAALRLAALVRAQGGEWGSEQYRWLAGRYPAGQVPETALEQLAAEFSPAAQAPVPARGGLAIVR